MKRLVAVLLMVGLGAPAFAGDPRESINATGTASAAVDMTALEPAEAIQQAQTPQPAFNRREPVLALVLSWVLPGLGQLYNGPTEKNKGLIMMAAEAGLITLAFVGASRSNTCDISGYYDVTCSGTSPLVTIGLLGMVGNSVYSMYDGYSRAGAINRQHGLALNVRPEIVAGRTGVSASARYHVSW